MDIKRFIYLRYISFRAQDFLWHYKEYHEKITNISPDIARDELVKILLHSQKYVPYYSDLMSQVNNYDLHSQSPQAYLQRIPILTKKIIRERFEQLKSSDLDRRRWYFNTSGGSTGEPVKLIQDIDYNSRSSAITALYSYLIGKEIGDPEVRLWGSERDIFQGSMGWKANFFSFLSNTSFMNAFRMSPDRMRAFILTLNAKPPKLIVAYAQSIYELARFAESEKIQIIPQKAIITSAGTLYPWMREKIESVFMCKVYNRYGSREVGDIACEQPGGEGLWVAPWGNYVEIVDDENEPVPEGVEGNILITSLTNYAMPLIRYKIGDRGSLLSHYPSGQILKRVSGRNVDTFKTKKGTLIDGEYFTHLLYFKDWVKRFQFIQNSYSEINVKIVKSHSDYPPEEKEIKDIIKQCQIVMGDNCTVNIDFVDEIPPSISGKFCYTISEVN